MAALAAAMLWQERRTVPEPDGAIIYGVEDSVVFVWERLDPEVRDHLHKRDVRRILELEMMYLQQPRLREDGRPAVVGGVEAAAYAQDRAVEEGHPYEPDVIFAVLDLQADYLAALGAVAEPADDSREEPAP